MKTGLIAPSDPRVVIIGRADRVNPMRPRLAYPGVTIRFRFTGSAASLALVSDSDTSYLTTVIDHGEPQVRRVSKGTSELIIADNLDAGPHTAQIVKRTETWQGILTLLGVRLAQGGMLLDAPLLSQRKLLFIGDSVTCGAGVDNYPSCPPEKGRSSNGYDTYGMVLGRRLDAQVHLVCYGGRGVLRDYRGLRNVLNGPQFFRYSIPSDDVGQRSEWTDTRWVPNAIILSFGTNDFSLEKTDPILKDEFVSVYMGFLHELVSRYPTALIFVTQGSIVTDPRLSEYVRETVARMENERVRWVESRHFAGSKCDAHPDLIQHRQIADDLEPILRAALSW